MYIVLIVLLMAVLPIVSIAIDAMMSAGTFDLLTSATRWFVFWGAGVRLALAGLRQIAQPAFTAETIFRIKDPEAHKIVQELGFGNMALGVLGIVAGFVPDWVLPAAVASAIFYALAGIKHVLNAEWTRLEAVAMISDLGFAAILIVLVAGRLIGF